MLSTSPQSLTNSIGVHTADVARLENQTEREQRFLKTFSIILFVAECAAFLIFWLVFFLSGQAGLLILIGLIFAAIFICGFSYWCSQRQQIGLNRLGSRLLMGITMLEISLATYLFGASQPIPAAFLIPIILSLFLLPWYSTLGVCLASITITVTFNILEGLNGFQGLIVLDRSSNTLLSCGLWPLILAIPSALGVYLLWQLNRAYNSALTQNEQLKQAIADIENKQYFGEEVGQRINSMTAELNATANQQASASQQQAAAISEATNFFMELTRTAQAIAAKAGQINQAVNQILGSTRQVKNTTGTVNQTGTQGLIAVEQTIASNQRVSDLYLALVEILTRLQNRSREIKQVTGLIREISNETHLLALNAALEAAGAGQYGERFNVVAQEVKALSNRSLQRSQEIANIIQDIENWITEAVATADNGQKEMQAALTIAEESGAVINELALAIEHSASEVEKIELAVDEVNEQTNQIRLATGEQYNSSTLTLETLQELGSIAQQSAAGSLQVTATARTLEELSKELTLTLAA
jgi:methyl-accepting chemotaxis protein